MSCGVGDERVSEAFFRDSLGVRAAAVGVAAAIGSAYFFVLALDGRSAARLGWEDGPIESAGAVLFLVAGVGFVVAATHSARRRIDATDGGGHRTIAFAVLAIVMLVSFGEEVSWGQRMFGWRTPSVFSSLNAQNEINLHNLQAVHQWNMDGSEKGFLGKLVNMNRLFSVFWLAVFVVLPLAVTVSGRVRRLVDRSGWPVPPLWVGGLFLSSYLSYKVLAFAFSGSLWAHTLDELKETGYAAVYAYLSLCALFAGPGPKCESSK